MAAQPSVSHSTAASGTEIELTALGELTPISRSGGQGRVYYPERQRRELATSIVVKLYRSRLPPSAMPVLTEMVAWGHGLTHDERWRLHRVAAWPLATVTTEGALTGIVMQDVRPRFELPFLMPSGRVAKVMLQLEHLLGPDDFLRQRGHEIVLDTYLRARVAERICAAFAFLHQHAIVVSDVSPSNLLISLAGHAPEVSFIDCDSMVFRGRQALSSVETADWQLPRAFAEQPLTRAADAYKLGLLILRLFARSSDARDPTPHLAHVPVELHRLLSRALSEDASNRPPAGEWQLALRRTLADEQLLRRHPAPSPPMRVHKPARTARAIEHRAPVGTMSAAGATAMRRAQPAQTGVSAGVLPRGFTVAWLVAGVLLLLLFVRLLQGMAIPSNAMLGLRETAARPGAGYIYRSPEGSFLHPGSGGPAEEEGAGAGGTAGR